MGIPKNTKNNNHKQKTQQQQQKQIKMQHTDLHNVFVKFSKNTIEMDGREFVKMCKDSGLLNKRVTSTSADIAFSKVKGLGQRKIGYNQFIQAINTLADEQGVSRTKYYERILGSSGPQFNGTKAFDTRLHDDKSTYTGVYAHGGPTNVDYGRGADIHDISQLVNRQPADIRGRLAH